MSIKDEDVIQVPNWNAARVETWLTRRKLPESICRIFRKDQIDGHRLLDLPAEEVREICREANVNKKNEFILMDSVKMLQKQYYDVQRGYRRRTNQQSRRRNRSYHRGSSSNMRTDIKNARNYRNRWTETELRKAWKLWLKYENLKTVSSKIGRTYIATLTKMNLIRRSILESNNEEYEANITDADKVHFYNLTKIVKEQKEKEDQKDQWARMKETGVNIEFEELGEMSTDDEYNEEDEDEEEHKFHQHRNRNSGRKRKRQMSLSEDDDDDDDDEPIMNRLNRIRNDETTDNRPNHNHNHNRLKRRFMSMSDEDEDKDNEDESEEEEEEEIQKKQEELWGHDRHLSKEEREQLADKGIYVIESLMKHKKDDEDEEYEFYVKWFDYDSDDNTWEPESNIPKYMVKAYWERRRKARNSKRRNIPPAKKRRRIVPVDQDEDEYEDSDIEIMK
eukprot:CAMPEP_0201573324 /NCGR_PEP_ID=MMETSP0190_2-20130828/17107_1 /ASSEMBLY_ACC=CAM_ASM_000263 /TAXON_ID=37353 /ORGANISM="Rosalina sp." /LENGTH=448 /DNA_ID=CAMNT_0048000157 /DNA_START=75 /DNA_END=1421 /DNA_ORIENTATION=+